MTNLSGKPSGQNSFRLHHENPYLQPFFPPASNGSGVCMSCFIFNALYPRSMFRCLTFSFGRLSKLMGKYSKASEKEQCIWYPEAQIENASCKPMMQTFSKKCQKKPTQLVRRRRRAQHRQRKLANKIATYNQDDDANSSSSSSSSFKLIDSTIRISRSIAGDLAIADYSQV